MDLEQYIERLVLTKLQLESGNQQLMKIVSFLVKDKKDFKEHEFLELTTAQLEVAPEINIQSPDGVTIVIQHA